MNVKQKNESDSSKVFICITEKENLIPILQINLPTEAINCDCRQLTFMPVSNRIAAKVMNEDFFLWDNNKLVRVDTKKILYVEADRCYCEIHLADGRKFVPSLSMGEVARHLSTDSFVRIHRSFIVNRKMMEEINGNRIFLQNGKELPIGRHFRKALLQSLNIINTQNKKYFPADCSDTEDVVGTK
jgi:hypothetical protein